MRQRRIRLKDNKASYFLFASWEAFKSCFWWYGIIWAFLWGIVLLISNCDEQGKWVGVFNRHVYDSGANSTSFTVMSVIFIGVMLIWYRNNWYDVRGNWSE